MEKKKSSFAWGIILILFGALLLANQLVPGLQSLFDWPWIVMGVGAVFILLAIFTQTGGLAIPGCIVGGIGAILYYQSNLFHLHIQFLYRPATARGYCHWKNKTDSIKSTQ